MRPPFAVADRAVPEAVRIPPLADRVEQRILCEAVYERFEKAAVANLAVGVEQEDKACVGLSHPLVESGAVEDVSVVEQNARLLVLRVDPPEEFGRVVGGAIVDQQHADRRIRRPERCHALPRHLRSAEVDDDDGDVVDGEPARLLQAASKSAVGSGTRHRDTVAACCARSTIPRRYAAYATRVVVGSTRSGTALLRHDRTNWCGSTRRASTLHSTAFPSGQPA